MSANCKRPGAKVAKEKAKSFDFPAEDKKKYLSGSEDEVRAGETPVLGRMTKKTNTAEFDGEGAVCAVRKKVQSMLEKLGADFSKAM